jgi:hypothetical protein
MAVNIRWIGFRRTSSFHQKPRPNEVELAPLKSGTWWQASSRRRIISTFHTHQQAFGPAFLREYYFLNLGFAGVATS